MLQLQGHVVVQAEHYAHCKRLLSAVGTTRLITDVRDEAGPPGMLHSSTFMSLHTDHPDFDIVAWYCAAQAEQGGESNLADFSAVRGDLSPHCIEALQAIQVGVPSLDPANPRGRLRRLLADDGIYFADWLIAPTAARQYAEALDEFQRALRHHQFSVRLRKGDILIIDNRRMLHGRQGFSDGADGGRHLVRHWMVAAAPAAVVGSNWPA